MIILGREPAERLRRTQERLESTGRVEIANSAPVAFTGSFQPISGADLQRLSEGERERVTLKVYTRADLRTSQQGGNPADLILYAGSVWEVQRVERFPGAHPIPHYVGFLMRLDEATGLVWPSPDPPPPDPSAWILQTGAWADAGVWVDSAVWEDGV